MSTDPPPMATPRVAAGVLYRDQQDRILCVKPTYKDGWDIPGGYVEPGESPHQAAVREVHEELGTDLPVGRLLVVDWAPHPDEGDKLLFVFDGGYVPNTSDVQIDGIEILTCSFWPAQSLDGRMPDRLARRLRLALEAARDGSTSYAEMAVRPA